MSEYKVFFKPSADRQLLSLANGNAIPLFLPWSISSWLILSLLVGCQPQPQRNDTDGANAPLSAQEARAAIVTLVEHSDYEELKMSLPSLRKAEITQVNPPPNTIQLGKWELNLKTHTFVVAVDAPPIFAEYHGVIERTPDKGWMASITDITRN